MTNVYFNEKGITSTEGNHLCNIAKELQQAAINRLNSVKFFETTTLLLCFAVSLSNFEIVVFFFINLIKIHFRIV